MSDTHTVLVSSLVMQQVTEGGCMDTLAEDMVRWIKRHPRLGKLKLNRVGGMNNQDVNHRLYLKLCREGKYFANYGKDGSEWIT
jgi:hypothetical protein